MAIHPTTILTLSSIFLSVVLYDFQPVSAKETLIKCTKREREALLKFKKGLIDNDGHLSSWGSDDECCEWEGVQCGYTTVIGLNMEGYHLQGNISSTLLELHHLNELNLGSNDFGLSQIPEFIGSIETLLYLRLDGSNFSGTIPPQLGNLTNLLELDLSKNQLHGQIPVVLCNLTSLMRLRLHNNKITGSVPTSVGQFSILEELDVSHNFLEGIISEAHFKQLHNLLRLSLSFNALTLQLGPDWVPPFNLRVIGLARCKMGPSFPTWLQTQSEFDYLDISDNGISNEAPKWLWNLSTYIKYLDISDNEISGTIPDFLSSNENYISILDVSSNKFSGPLPLFHPNTTQLRFNKNAFSGSISYVCASQGNTELLDLSNNLLSGAIPDCWENMTTMVILNLSNNSFSGKVPQSFGSLSNLITLHLRDNNLSGELPSTMKNCQSLRLIDVAGNELTGHIPSWVGGSNYANMVLLNLRQNMFYGGIPSEICTLTQIQILDLAGNNMSGEIPRCFNNFTSFVDKNYTSIEDMTDFGLTNYRSIIYDSLIPNKPFVSLSPVEIESYVDYALVQWKGQSWEYKKSLVFLKLIDLSSNQLVGSIPASFSSLRGLISLNLSSNSLTGNIIPNIGQMEELEVLDLSRNQLSGEIPKGIGRLSFLAVVDLARNNLSGEIPLSTQLQRQDASVYYGNNGLCGPPLPPCYVNTSTNNQEHMKNKDGLKEFWIPLVFGAIIGFWGFVGSLVLKRSWRYTYFNVLDVVGGWLYVNIVIFLSKMRRG